MKIRIIGYLIALLILAFILVIAYNININNENNLNPEYLLSSYPEISYFKFDPERIPASLAQGDIDVFVPLIQEPNLVAPVTSVSISWTQRGFLKIASALGQSVWGDPMSAKDWQVSSIIFSTTCQENPTGFNFSEITYYKTINENGKQVYITRHIEINPNYGIIRLGSGATYPRPIIAEWKGFDITQFVITAEDALQIADKNGGKDARLKVDNSCIIYVSSFKNNSKWYIDYAFAYYSMLVDPYTGSYEMLNISQ